MMMAILEASGGSENIESCSWLRWSSERCLCESDNKEKMPQDFTKTTAAYIPTGSFSTISRLPKMHYPINLMLNDKKCASMSTANLRVRLTELRMHKFGTDVPSTGGECVDLEFSDLHNFITVIVLFMYNTCVSHEYN